ncbi:MAG: hypothetical protein JSV02_03495 [Dehalococcoidia bacterium]|nr:MAG: hypothetical protein JSV02_03495 [Dehalococcoidia bacterium]
MERYGRVRLGWIEEACVRLLDSAGGVIEDWPDFKAKLYRERRRHDSLKPDVLVVEQGRPPTILELEEAWLSLESRGYVRLEYEKLSLKRISRLTDVSSWESEEEILYDVRQSRLNLACDILSCVLILPGALVNHIFGPLSLAFALAMTGSKRRWGVFRIIGTAFGSILAVAFIYNIFR